MTRPLQHDLFVQGNRNDQARQNFVSSLRAFVLNDVAGTMKHRFEQRIAPALPDARKPQSGPDVHRAIQGDHVFQLYSSMRYNAQEMVWRSVGHPLNEAADAVTQRAQDGMARADAQGGTLTLDPAMAVPRNVTAIDVHLAPGGYHTERGGDADVVAGALYDHGLNIFSFGLMGANLDDIGQSMAQYIWHLYPDFQPRHILDTGCTVGHNTCAWKTTYPAAEVTGIAVAAPCLRYAHARAGLQGQPVHFRQMNATALDFPDDSFDVVFSSMFLHELPVKDIHAALGEAYRVLRPGGLMLHMELPPNAALDPYDAFYLDWDAYYNNEPFYKAFRDQDYRALCRAAGFAGDSYIEFVTPQYTYMAPEAYAEAVTNSHGVGETTGRLADGIEWYGFGAWK